MDNVTPAAPLAIETDMDRALRAVSGLAHCDFRTWIGGPTAANVAEVAAGHKATLASLPADVVARAKNLHRVMTSL
jgi:hypothetical protein